MWIVAAFAKQSEGSKWLKINLQISKPDFLVKFTFSLIYLLLYFFIYLAWVNNVRKVIGLEFVLY